MTRIGHFGAIDDQTIRPSGSGFFFEEIGLYRLLRPLRFQRLPRSMRLQRFLRSGKSTNEVFKVIQVLEFNNPRTKITLF